MEACSWDWGTIGSFAGAGATLLGVVVAVCISKQWKNQKSSEVIAVESKDVINLLLKNEVILGHIKNENDDVIKEKLELINDDYLILLGRILYLNIAIPKLTSDIKLLAEKYITLIQSHDIKMDTTNPYYRHVYLAMKHSDTFVTNHKACIEDISIITHRIVEVLHPYSIYKKLYNPKSV